MRRTFLLLAIIGFFSVGCNNEERNSKDEEKDKELLSTDLINNPRSAEGTSDTALQALATMNFRDTVHDFGSIKEGEVVSYDFEFTNTGKRPLIISSANGSCGCTVADFPREPLAPGKASVIKVQFSSAGKEGHQEKSVTLVNNTAKGKQMLFIKGDVKK
jgi:hypothetical protein